MLCDLSSFVQGRRQSCNVMDLGVRESAQLLKVSEKTIYRWVKQGKLPAYRVNEQYRFNRAELLEWATSQRLNVSANIFAEPDGETPMVTLTEALRAGGIHYRLGGSDKFSVLQSLVEIMPLPDQVDRQFLFQVLLARESLGSTALGNGIAVPHVRNPIVMHIVRPMVTLCFLERAVEFGALDGQPVHTLFTIVSPTIRAHLHLLARLSFALRQAIFADAIAEHGAREAILAATLAVDQSLSQSASSS
jgi:nitrogen PTS system EIIA component